MDSNVNRRRVITAALLLVAALAGLSTATPAFAQEELEVGEKLSFKSDETKLERQGQLDSQSRYVYLLHAEPGQRLSVAAVFRGNLKPDSVFRDNVAPKDEKPNAVFRDNFVLDLRGPRPPAGGEPARVADFKDGDTEWSGTIKEGGDYLIIVSRAARDAGKAAGDAGPLRYALRVSLR